MTEPLGIFQYDNPVPYNANALYNKSRAGYARWATKRTRLTVFRREGKNENIAAFINVADEITLAAIKEITQKCAEVGIIISPTDFLRQAMINEFKRRTGRTVEPEQFSKQINVRNDLNRRGVVSAYQLSTYEDMERANSGETIDVLIDGAKSNTRLVGIGDAQLIQETREVYAQYYAAAVEQSRVHERGPRALDDFDQAIFEDFFLASVYNHYAELLNADNIEQGIVWKLQGEDTDGYSETDYNTFIEIPKP